MNLSKKREVAEIVSNQAECDAIYHLYSTTSFIQQLFIWAPTLLWRFSHAYICLDVYPETVRLAIIQVLFSQHVLVIPLFIIVITESILLVI